MGVACCGTPSAQGKSSASAGGTGAGPPKGSVSTWREVRSCSRTPVEGSHSSLGVASCSTRISPGQVIRITRREHRSRTPEDSVSTRREVRSCSCTPVEDRRNNRTESGRCSRISPGEVTPHKAEGVTEPHPRQGPPRHQPVGGQLQHPARAPATGGSARTSPRGRTAAAAGGGIAHRPQNLEVQASS